MKLIGIFLLISVICFTGACMHNQEKDIYATPLPAEELYQLAMKAFSTNNFIDAFEAFQQCKTRYPISELGIKAALKMADCLYYQKQFETAFVQYQEFSRLHPTHPSIDYIYYQMGMCYYSQMCSLDRDQSFTQEAIKQFDTLLSLFPSSLYAPSVRRKIEECKTRLAEHTLYIANYYFRTKAYNPAAFRYLEALTAYRDYIQSPDLILFQIGKSYLHIKKPENAREQFVRLLTEYPQSPYSRSAESLLEDPKQIEGMDEIKILEELNPVRAIKSIPIPFTGKGEKKS